MRRAHPASSLIYFPRLGSPGFRPLILLKLLIFIRVFIALPFFFLIGLLVVRRIVGSFRPLLLGHLERAL
tara:strand:- start:32 stop:241 length:210 start_codon:yes stop_codon:yes gene_type:complete